MKPGIRTSEFWIMVIGAIATLVAEMSGMEIDAEDLAMIWGPAMAYIVSRGLAKMKTPPDA